MAGGGGSYKPNTELVPLKIVLFLWYGGTACVLPFLTVHMRQLGLSVEETAIIYTIIPFAQLLGPHVAGFLGDKYGRYKHAFLSCLVLTALSGSSLLLVPQAVGPPPPSPAIHLLCGPSLELEVVVDHCGDEHGNCPEPSAGEALPVQLADCVLDCPDDDYPHGIEDAGICFTDDYNNKECHRVDENETIDSRMSVGLYLQPARDPDSLCFHPVTAVLWHNHMFHNVSCLQHLPDHDHTNCSLKCNIEDHPEVNMTSAAEFWHAECTPPEGSDRRITICVYFLLRVVFQVLVSVCFTYLDATTVMMVRLHRGRFAWQRLWAIVGSVFSSPLSGFFIDVSSEHVITGFDYSPAFYMFNVFAVLTAIFTYVLDLDVAHPGKSGLQRVRELLRIPELLSLFLVAFGLGSVYGFLEYFLFWYLLDSGAPNYMLGLTISVGGLTGFAFLKESKRFFNNLGYVNIIILAGLVYCGRLVGYSFIGNHFLWCIPLEALEAMTFHLLWVAVGTYGTQNAPTGLKATVQTCVGGLYFGVGRSAGSLFGGTAMYFLGASTAFRIMAGVAALTSLSYACIYYCCLHKPCVKPKDGEATNQPPDKPTTAGGTAATSVQRPKGVATNGDAIEVIEEDPAPSSSEAKVS